MKTFVQYYKIPSANMDILFVSKRIFIDGEDGLVDGGILVTPEGKIRKLLRTNGEVNSYMYSNQPDEVLDFGNKVLMPGLIDSQVYINEPGRSDWEGFVTGTKAAAAGGFTTIVDMPLNSIPPTTTKENLKAKTIVARGKIYVDVAFWGGAVSENNTNLKALAETGIVGIQCFLCPSGVPEFSSLNEDQIKNAMKQLEGCEIPLAFHAEQEPTPIILPDESKPKKYETFLNTRPPSMEVNAIKMISKLASKSNVRVHISTLCASEAIPIIRECRENGGKITVETCHHYLSLAAEDIPDARTEFKCSPPIRNRANQDNLWQAILKKDIDLVSSGHLPCTPGLKMLNYGKTRGDFLKARGGIASNQFGISIFWTNCIKHGIRSIKDVHHFLCKNPAKLCGLDGVKGKIAEGYDADFCIWDPDEEFYVTPNIIHFQNKANPYMDSKLYGMVHATVVRGLHVYQLHEAFGQPLGKVILRKSLNKKIVKFT